MSLPSIIGISGKAQHGKDTVATILAEEYGYRRFAFADALKRIAYDTDPMIDAIHSMQWLVDQMGWDEAKKIPEVRSYLQRLGAAARNNLDKGVWIRAAMRGVDDFVKDGGKAVITDMRYQNEHAALFKRGAFLLRVERPGLVDGTHLSETDLDDSEFSAVITNDGTIQDLVHAVCATFDPAQGEDEADA